MKLPEPYLPRTLSPRQVQWFISPVRATEPIHLFRSRRQARAWAKTQPDLVIGEVVVVPNFDWFHKGDKPHETISPTRQFVDHRGERIATVPAEQKRQVLRNLGYLRRDRTSGGKHRELWVHEMSASSCGKSMESCWKHVIRHGFVYVCQETNRIIYHFEDEE